MTIFTLVKAFNLMLKLKKIFYLLPKKHKTKATYFIVFLLLATILETAGIGLIFPLLELAINGEASQNIFSQNLKNFFKDNQISIEDLIFIILFLYFFKTIYLIYFNYWQQKFSQKIYKDISLKLLNFYLKSPLKFYYKKNSSELLRNTLNECKNYGGIVSITLRLFVECFVVIFLFALVFYIEPMKTFYVSLIIIINVSLYYVCTKKKIYNYGITRVTNSEKQIKVLLESFSGIRDIKLKSSENFFLKLYNKFTKNFTSASYKQQTIIDAPRYLFEFIFLCILLISLLIYMKSNENLNSILPILGLYLVTSFKLVPSLMKILNSVQQINGLQPSINILDVEFANFKKEIKTKIISDKKPELFFRNEISISDVNFSYDKRESVLNSFSENIKKNSYVGIIGRSGSGKSTLIDIITGLISPHSGQILVDGKSINENLESWQNKIGYVSQNSFLLDSSIIENVAFGVDKKNINLDKVKKALSDAQIINFVANLENKFDTVVGEKGLQLSGGQKQRIAIARELYRSPELLILDEATSALDEETENQFLEFLDNLKGKITVLISSHRSNTFKKCDRIINLD
jgi:ATP-binding cassette, subfamily B, bacterial PglK